MLPTSGDIYEKFKWVGNLCFLIGAILVSVSAALAVLPGPYFAFLVGHILWSISAIKMKDKALIAMNVGLVALDAYAIIVRI